MGYSTLRDIFGQWNCFNSKFMDDEGNDAGAILTNIKDLSCIPVFRESYATDWLDKK